MANAYFELSRSEASPAAGQYLSAEATAGPWDPSLQHGGPPSALVVRAAERLAAADRDDLVAYRLAAEFVGPVPVAEVSTQARIVRAARSGVLVDVTLAAAGRDCLHGRVWLVRRGDTTAIAHPPGPAPAPPPPGSAPFGMKFPYADSIDWHEMSGSIATPGPGTVWARPRLALVEGEQLAGLQRVAVIADSASGISAELDWARWSFLNVDLDVHLARPFAGEWVHLAARTTLGEAGAGLARSTLSDQLGEVGTTSQTLVVTPRRH